MGKKIVFLLLIIIALKGCTRDDICPEGTATTPNLIIVFNNNTNPEIRKSVEGLSVETDYENPITVLPTSTTDSIAVPLSTTSDTTKYRFIQTLIAENDTIVNIDKIMFLYSRQDLYVNRACGFKTEFQKIGHALENEGNENWILNITTDRDTISDENSAHLTFFH